ncbi:MAG: mucin-binding protein [Streptococcus sp.]
MANVNLVTGAINYEAWSSTQAGFSAVPSPEVVWILHQTVWK